MMLMNSAVGPLVGCWSKLIGNVGKASLKIELAGLQFIAFLFGCLGDERLDSKDYLVCDKLPNRIKDRNDSRGIFIDLPDSIELFPGSDHFRGDTRQFGVD
jgi:hypothetical protein